MSIGWATDSYSASLSMGTLLTERPFNSVGDPFHTAFGTVTGFRFAALSSNRLQLVIKQDSQHLGAPRSNPTQTLSCSSTMDYLSDSSVMCDEA